MVLQLHPSAEQYWILPRRDLRSEGHDKGGNCGNHARARRVGYGLAAIGPGIGIGIATYGLCTAAARQPEMKGTLMGYFFIGAAMSEALALLGLVLFFIG